MLAHTGEIHGLDLFTLALSVVVPLAIAIGWAVRAVGNRRNGSGA